VEIYSQNRTAVIDNFRRVKYYGFRKSRKSGTQDKGHFNQFQAWLAHVQQGGEAVIPFASLLNTSKAAIAAVESLQQGTWVHVD
jgi:predicted dehydrogenase